MRLEDTLVSGTDGPDHANRRGDKRAALESLCSGAGISQEEKETDTAARTARKPVRARAGRGRLTMTDQQFDLFSVWFFVQTLFQFFMLGWLRRIHAAIQDLKPSTELRFVRPPRASLSVKQKEAKHGD
jgi:hypothetical protein